MSRYGTPGFVADMDSHSRPTNERDDQEEKVAKFNKIYNTLIEQNISAELATLDASRALGIGSPSTGPRFTSTPHTINGLMNSQQGTSTQQ